MIINLNTTFTLKHPDDVLTLSEQDRKSIKHLDVSQWYFVIPNSIEDDYVKLVYKLGFLVTLLKHLQPENNYSVIFKKVKNEWHIFKSERQMERLLKRYREIYINQEEV